MPERQQNNERIGPIKRTGKLLTLIKFSLLISERTGGGRAEENGLVSQDRPIS